MTSCLRLPRIFSVGEHSAGSRKRNDLALFLGVALLVLASRLPFLAAGYGRDPDAWRVANTARAIATTGRYSVSRFPGYPVQELAYALLWRGGPIALNGATALFSALAAGLFALILRGLGGRDAFLAALAFASVPIVFVNSTTAMDYLWALAFVLASLYCVLARRPVAGGVLLGVAIGCRITSSGMVLPLGLLLLGEERTERWRHVLRFAAAALLTGGAMFLPVMLVYGTSFLTYAESDRVDPLQQLRQANSAVWGAAGHLAILVALFSLLLRRRLPHESSIAVPLGPAYTGGWVLAILVNVGAFIALPHEFAYLIPSVPFALLLMAKALDRRVFRLVCGVLLVSPFVTVSSAGVGQGPLLVDYAGRRDDMRAVRRMLALSSRLDEASVIVAGGWLPQIEAGLDELPSDQPVTYVYLLGAAQLQAYVDRGYAIYYLPGQRDYNREQLGVDIYTYGARPLHYGAREQRQQNE